MPVKTYFGEAKRKFASRLKSRQISLDGMEMWKVRAVTSMKFTKHCAWCKCKAVVLLEKLVVFDVLVNVVVV